MSICTSCGKPFGFFKWKHVCHACGHVFCNACSEGSLIIEPGDLIMLATPSIINDWDRPHRCCDPCFERITNRRQLSTSRGQSPWSRSTKLNDAGAGSDATAVTDVANKPKKFEDVYTLGEKIGSGGSSEVRLAKNKEGENFAVKVLKVEKLSSQDIASVYSEVQLLSTLRHPNVVRLYDFFEQPTHFYIVEEAVLGGELFDRIVKKITYSEREARDLVLVLLDAIKYFHDKNIVHR
jgi:serine/threonine protein kinase